VRRKGSSHAKQDSFSALRDLLLLLLILCPCQIPQAAEKTSAQEILTHPDTYDGKEVLLEGQATQIRLARRQEAYHERAQSGQNLGTVGKKMASFTERPISVTYGVLWCRRSGSNRHGHEVRGILSPVRLPVSPLRHPFLPIISNAFLSFCQGGN
jgi:hypothetical protein